MNVWLEHSIEYANQRSYLDDLFRVYPTIPDGIRQIDEDLWVHVETAFHRRDNEQLIKVLLQTDLFPIKDSYVAYLRRDRTAIFRNPQTVARLAGRIYELGLDKLWDSCSQPKETNGQISPMFHRWLQSQALGLPLVPETEFLASKGNAILNGSDKELMIFARKHLGYARDKGLDFVGRFGGKYVLGEAKFLTDMGGHQNAQFEDAMLTLRAKSNGCIHVAILDGVLYIPNRGKLYQRVINASDQEYIMSALVFRNFLYSI